MNTQNTQATAVEHQGKINGKSIKLVIFAESDALAEAYRKRGFEVSTICPYHTEATKKIDQKDNFYRVPFNQPHELDTTLDTLMQKLSPEAVLSPDFEGCWLTKDQRNQLRIITGHKTPFFTYPEHTLTLPEASFIIPFPGERDPFQIHNTHPVKDVSNFIHRLVVKNRAEHIEIS